jgi:predicted small secreted protein
VAHAILSDIMNPILIFSNSYCQRPVLSTIRGFAILAAGLLIMAAATSCNAARGLGQDVEQTGENIQRAARR